MAIQVEFEIEGRTYRVELGLREWNIYAVKILREKIAHATDLNSGEDIFLDWSSVPVMRLVKSE